MSDVSIEDVRFLEIMTECAIPIENSRGDETMNVNKAMDEYFMKHDAEVIENATPKIIEDATPKIIEDATPRIIENATPKIIEDATPKIIEDATPKIIEDAVEEMVRRMVKCGMPTDDIQRITFWSVEQIETLRQNMNKV